MENEKLVVENTHVVFIKPLQFYWKPKEDITSFELALCIPFLIRFTSIMPGEVDKSQKHFRHFEIIDPNSISVSTTANQESNKKDTLEQKGFDIPNNSCTFPDPTKRSCTFPDPTKRSCTFPDPTKRYCTFPDPTKSYCTFPDLVVVQNTFKDSKEPINFSNTTTSTAEVDLDNPLTKPTGL